MAPSTEREGDVSSDLGGARTTGDTDETIAAGDGTETSEVDIGPGDTVGRYVVEARLGAGGMGVVHRAFDPELDRPVALKLLRAHGRRGTDVLLAEAQAMARLAHPNVITVHDVGIYTSRLFVAMEYLEGQTLGAWQKGRAADAILDAYRAAARGLAAAHDADLVHRDFKPDNVIVCDDGRVVVLDFGLARLSSAEAVPETAAHPNVSLESTSDGATVTTGGRSGSSRSGSSLAGSSSRTTGRAVLGTQTVAAMAGTPAYMSPEQHLGHVVDHRSDQFSLCVALFEAVYGTAPFGGHSLVERSLAVLDGTPPDPPRGIISGRFRAAILRGLARDPSARHPSMHALLAELRPRRVGPGLIVGGVVASVLGAAAVLSFGDGGTGADVCTGGDARVAEVWSSARREHLEAALPADDPVTARLLTTLDDWTGRWPSAHREACQATAVRKEQSGELLDLRMACLDRALVELDESMTVLEEAGDKLRDQAPRVVAGLPALGRCADTTELLARVAPADDPDPRRTERALSRIRALEHAGRYGEALDGAALLVEELRNRGAASQLPAAYALWGNVALQLDESVRAVEILRDGVVEAERVGDERMRAKMLLSSIHAYGRAGDLPAAKYAARVTRALIERLDMGAEPLAAVERHLGVGALQAGRPGDAKQHYVRAFELDPEDRAGFHERRASMHNNLGLAHRDLGESELAIEQFRKAHDLWAEFYGVDHPAVAIARMNLGTTYDEVRRYDDALVEYSAAREVFARTLGPDSLDVGYCFEAEAISLGEQKKYDLALASHEKAQAIFRPKGEEAAADLAMSLDNMGVVHNRLGDRERAVALHRESLRIWEEAVGSTHPDLAYPLGNLGHALIELRRYPEALVALERAYRLREDAQVGPFARATTEYQLARAMWTTDRARARQLARDALGHYEKANAADHVAKVRAWLEAHATPVR